MKTIFSLREITELIRDAIKPNVDFRIVRKTALKYFTLEVVIDIEGVEDYEVTGSQALRIIKVFAKAHNVNLKTSSLASFLEYEVTVENKKPVQIESEIFDPHGKLALGKDSSVIEKPGYSEWVSYFGQEPVLCPDFHREEWEENDWYAQYQYIIKQNMTSSELVNLLESVHPENRGLMIAAAIAWAQCQPADGFFAEACIMAKNTKLVDIESQMYSSYWNDDFELFITSALAVVHLETFLKTEENQSPSFIDVTLSQGTGELKRRRSVSTRIEKVRDAELIPKKPAKPVTFSIEHKRDTANAYYKSKQSPVYSEEMLSHNG